MSKKKPKRRKPTEPVFVFINAQAFQLAAEALNVQPDKHIFMYPMAANEAFSLELYLKTLHRVRRRYVEGHDIEAIFRRLTVTDQQAIELRYNARIMAHRQYHLAVAHGLKLDLDSVLRRCKDAFIKIRYWHEGKMPSQNDDGKVSNAGTGTMCDAIRDYIIDLRPEWGALGIRNPLILENLPLPGQTEAPPVADSGETK